MWPDRGAVRKKIGVPCTPTDRSSVTSARMCSRGGRIPLSRVERRCGFRSRSPLVHVSVPKLLHGVEGLTTSTFALVTVVSDAPS